MPTDVTTPKTPKASVGDAEDAGATETAVVNFCRLQSPDLQLAPVEELVRKPLAQALAARAEGGTEGCLAVVMAQWRLRWCDAVVALEDDALVIARAEPGGKAAARTFAFSDLENVTADVPTHASGRTVVAVKTPKQTFYFHSPQTSTSSAAATTAWVAVRSS